MEEKRMCAICEKIIDNKEIFFGIDLNTYCHICLECTRYAIRRHCKYYLKITPEYLFGEWGLKKKKKGVK